MIKRILMALIAGFTLFSVLMIQLDHQKVYATAGDLLYTLENENNYSTSEEDQFGYSVSISDTYAIVGAYKEDDAGGTSSGAAYIYDLSDGSLLYTLENENNYGTSAGDQFGYSVSISDTYAIVGAHFEDDVGGTSSGA